MEDNNAKFYDAHEDSFIIASYNCRGFNTLKSWYIQQLLSQCSVLCLQETWLFESLIPMLFGLSNEFLCTGVSGFNANEILTGRPYGGCAVLWRSDVSAQIEIIDTRSRSLCAVKFKFVAYELLIVTVYLRYENDASQTDDLREQLFLIELIINLNPNGHTVLCGDFNVGFARNWGHTEMLNDFCERLFMSPTVRHCNNAVDYSYNFNMKYFHMLDHFVPSTTLFDVGVDHIRVRHDGDNLSDHDPIFLDLKLSFRFMSLAGQIYAPRPAWCKANKLDISRYQIILASQLSKLIVPANAVLLSQSQKVKTPTWVSR
jgi:endonuclease/exonuclease/phosphatase family metal-dependent hydrolase